MPDRAATARRAARQAASGRGPHGTGPSTAPAGDVRSHVLGVVPHQGGDPVTMAPRTNSKEATCARKRGRRPATSPSPSMTCRPPTALPRSTPAGPASVGAPQPHAPEPKLLAHPRSPAPARIFGPPGTVQPRCRLASLALGAERALTVEPGRHPPLAPLRGRSHPSLVPDAPSPPGAEPLTPPTSAARLPHLPRTLCSTPPHPSHRRSALPHSSHLPQRSSLPDVTRRDTQSDHACPRAPLLVTGGARGRVPTQTRPGIGANAVP